MLKIAKMLGLATGAIFLINAIIAIATYKNAGSVIWMLLDLIIGAFLCVLEGPEFLPCAFLAFASVITHFLEPPLYRFGLYLVLNLCWIGVGNNNWLAGIFTILCTLIWAYEAFFDKPSPGLATVAETQPVVA